ncbi:response regulator [Solimonas sp. C16B3]|uniref:histidine kinase n=1 Tax=Solimonas marina TaxID=2714601 RepID=A0A969W5D2_9GAMM|nr:response regulator [Solimonas marina]
MKCLLVDDLDENLLAMSALLRSEDVEVLQARSGAEALEVLLRHDVALAMVDVQMPDMDGFELAELMRGSERTRQVPIIFVTAGARDQHRLFKGYETGAVDFLYKPVDPYILRNKAGVFFQLYRQKQQIAQELHERTETLRLNEMFIAVLGHDLRNPLNSVMTLTTLLERVTEEEAVVQAAQRILGSSRRMQRMIEDMLDLARARLAGGIPLRRESVDLGPLMRRVVQEHQAMYPGRAIVESAVGDLHGDWDPDRVAQIASNLLGNALQHGDSSGDVELSLDGTHDAEVRLVVSNGGRISDDTLAHLFDPFRGGQRQPGRNQGLGLGLYIVHQIVRAHDGEVDVVTGSEGTAFHIRLPRRVVGVIKL